MCKYCKTKNHTIYETKDTRLFIENKELIYDDDCITDSIGIKINYCPMCGRKLGV